ncbi:23S rRNA (adenine(1618)-N(6))-methyltransferase RlmF [Ancylomarina sp. YFZ004]
MLPDKKDHAKIKSRLHPRNKNRERYDFKELLVSCPELNSFVILNKYDDQSIDFADPKAVKMLNKALLMHYYGLQEWDIPENYLCPPIPGRADYIHHIADLLCSSNFGEMPKGEKITCLDIGVGANCIYPIIGRTEYGWSFIGTDIDPIALASANKIIELNPTLKGGVECRLQASSKDYFYGVFTREESVDLTVCNPPFHASAEDALAASKRKVNNLNEKKVKTPTLNFGGQQNELWCEGGEGRFLKTMISESKKFGKSCFWFSSLVSKQSNLRLVNKILQDLGAEKVETIPMGQGNKTSRIVAWTFLNAEEQKEWRETRWK